MRLTDIHTHSAATNDDITAIVNSGESTTPEATNCSVGLHPWLVDNDWAQRMPAITAAAETAQVKAIGECGIDLTKGSADEQTQIAALRSHIELSKKLKKPLILHIVKGQEAIMRLRKEYAPTQAWIIHGFRGKPQQAQQYISAGFHLSYGSRFNKEALAATPIDRLFVESDESDTPLEDIYRAIADCLNISTEELAISVERNCRNCGLLP